ncbi:MAG: Gfo/Idh/MocA family oxidoreductase [Rhizobiales bacterium]|nr:Gfo/Idh/MocA family oxidoreductase [Hyphomicrobiales bacterium]
MDRVETRRAGIAFVGTGFVADYYMTTLANHPTLHLLGAFDRAQDQLRRFCGFYGVRAYASLDELLADAGVDIVINLTNPEGHFEISDRALRAGKHVYSEKPLAMDYGDAAALVRLADERGLVVAAAPANGLGAAYRSVEKALAAGSIGPPRLVYAEMDDGPVFRENWQSWRSRSGAPWPGPHEFEIGCTLEHAGYALTWLVSLFGPVERLTCFSALAFPDKGVGDHRLGPDFSVGCLNFRSGMIARLTSGLAAPRDRSFTILGDRGSITVRDLLDHHSVVHLERTDMPPRKTEKVLRHVEFRMNRKLPWKLVPGRRLAVEKDDLKLPNFPSLMDFCAGIAAQADAIEKGGAPFFSGNVALHITEIALALSNAGPAAIPYEAKSGFTFPAAA